MQPVPTPCACSWEREAGAESRCAAGSTGHKMLGESKRKRNKAGRRQAGGGVPSGQAGEAGGRHLAGMAE